jgi:hypothetical protein
VNYKKRPAYLTGTSESSLIDDTSRRNQEHTSLSTLHSLTEKININLYRVLHHGKDPPLPPMEHPVDEENELKVKILGFEIIERERRFTVFT